MRVRGNSVVATLLFSTLLASVLGAAASAAPRITSARATPPQRIPIKNGAGTARPLSRPIPVNAQRANVVQSVHHPLGRQVEGPAMLSPAEIDRVLSAARLQSSLRATRANGSASQRAAAPNGRSAGARTPGATRRTQTLSNASIGTGINPWWAYHDFSGAGRRTG